MGEAARPRPGDDAPMRGPRPTLRSLAAALALVAAAPMAHAGWVDLVGATLAQAGRHVASAAQNEWNEAMQVARDAHEGSIGLFALTTPDGADGLEWQPLDDLEVVYDPDEIVVVLVHGLDEPGGLWSDLAPAIDARGFHVVRFNYPNDQHPADSAEAFVAALEDLRADHGARHVTIVAHSMGGLVARDALTRDGLYGGDGSGGNVRPDVVRLITVGTPHHGSALVPLRPLGEAREQVARFMESGSRDPRELLRFMMDGRGEAAEALAPGSPFLEDLNARPMPRGVEMTVIIGVWSPVDGELVDEAMTWRAVRAVLDEEDAESLRTRLDILAATIGDGVVTVDSQRLEGVEDTVELDGNHRTLLRRLPALQAVRGVFGAEPSEPAAIPVILDRLAQDDCDDEDGTDDASGGF
jgi:pimeloyl-ACP methyl ester carboxylesterase